MATQLTLPLTIPDEPAPEWIEDLLREIEGNDLIAVHLPVLIVEIVPEIEGPIQ